MHIEIFRHLPVDEVEERDPLLVPVARHARADHVARQCAQRGEQGRRPMPFVVVRHRSCTPLLDRQTRLRTVERLNLALLIDREDERVLWRVEIKADNVFEFLHEVGIVADLEGADQVRLQPVAPPDALDARWTDAQLDRHGPRAPVRRVGRTLPRRLADNLGLDRAALHRRRSPTPRRVLLDPSRPMRSKPTTPEAHGLFPGAQLGSDGFIQPAVGGAQHDLGALHQTRWGASASRPLHKYNSIFVGHRHDGGNSRHARH